MKRPGERCRDKDRRRRDIRAHKTAAGEHDVNGIDYLEVDETQTVLTVYFLGKVPENVTTANVRIDGGRRVRVQVLDVNACDPEDARADGCLQITVDKPGDFSTYTLRLVQSNSRGRPGDEPLPGFDRRYAYLDFSFKAGCPTGLDCAPVPCAPEALDEPEIDYLAKDYASFRQLILDRLSLIMPEWTERHVPDLGIALVEVLAYVGDHLSYYQDAVATEAYLGTARQRISVRRHAKLVDYQVHEGCNARAWIYVEMDVDGALDDVSFISPTKHRMDWKKGTLGTDDMRNVPFGDYEVFKPVGEVKGRKFYQAHNRIAFYTWGDRECCLPRGATSATLVDQWTGATAPSKPETPGGDYGHKKNYDDDCPPDQPPPPPRPRLLHLTAGDVLIFEEVLGPITGQPADADLTHRHVVRLTKAETAVDALNDQPVIEIEWAIEDALPFPLCLSAIGRAPDCRYLEDVSVAHGNVILVDHGRPVGPESWEVPPITVQASCDVCEPITAVVPPPFRPPPLRSSPITHAAPYPSRATVARRQAQLLSQLMSAVHARVEQLWRVSQARVLSAEEIRELTTIFVAKAVKNAGLAKPGAQHQALAYLLDRAARLLARKSRRISSLMARARAGYVLGDDEKAEIVEMFGEALAARAGIGTNATLGPASLALIQDPREAIPSVQVNDGKWTPRSDLLESGPQDRHFVVEIDDDGRAHLRFGDGDGDGGRAPIPGSTLAAGYRVGNGTRGNVGAEAISKIVFPSAVISGRSLRVRNPLPARGGTEPEPLAEVKLFAPGAFRKVLERAVISDDYARLAERSDPTAIQRAAAPPLRWTGSWFEAQVAIDPRHAEELEDALRDEVDGYLHRYRRIGHDVRVTPARYVALDVVLTICVLPHYLRAHVEAELLDLFSNRDLGTGRRGFFHPDNLSFGEGVQLSRLVAAAQAVSGVESVTVSRLQRLHEDEHHEIEDGILPLRPLEVARLDNDPGVPDHGVLKLVLRGGR
jgi:predicted phage baseplate assembly protein